jgi:septal ring factor EnvC (AmiA/AmiB activator)
MNLNYYLLLFPKSMNKFTNTLLTCFILLCFSFSAIAQKKVELENKKLMLQKDIRYTESLLNETKINKKLSLNQLVTLNKKISIREELIEEVSSEISIIDRQIDFNKEIIIEKEADLNELKNEYAKMIYFAYKNQNAYDRLMFVFSSRDFNQAFNRLKYMQQYSDYRKKQAELIVSTQREINSKIYELVQKKLQKNELLGTEEHEKENLAKEKSEQEGVLDKLQKQEKDLFQTLKEKEKEQRQLQMAIQRIIEEEIKKARELAMKEAKDSKPKNASGANSNTNSNALSLTPETIKLSGVFEQNKTKLPWPVVEGIITGRFGQQAHPVLKNIKINNNGIDIATKKQASVRAIFDGVVTGIATVPGFGKVIMIRHGEYLTVYSKLKEINVKKGDKVVIKQTLGIVETEDSESKTEVHFEIWKGTIVLNPELWIFKNN